jgi:hypothetical protein
MALLALGGIDLGNPLRRSFRRVFAPALLKQECASARKLRIRSSPCDRHLPKDRQRNGAVSVCSALTTLVAYILKSAGEKEARGRTIRPARVAALILLALRNRETSLCTGAESRHPPAS